MFWNPARLTSVLGAALLAAGLAPAAAIVGPPQATYRNPIIFGDYSDPDVVRVGGDFYLVSSSFNAVPALPILHSIDLIHWEIIGHAAATLSSPRYDVPQHGNGIWAPSLRYHDGRYWIYVGDPDLGIFMTSASNPRGPWDPLTLVAEAKGWIDPCPLWDDDGQMYVVHAWARSRAGFNGVLSVRRLQPGGRRVDPRDADGRGVVIYEDDGTHPTIEGPKFYKRNGYYYVFAPAGGVTNGWQTVLRSKQVTGPYEIRTVMRRGGTPVNGPHQGAWVTTDSGEDWFLHFQDRGAYGRIVHLQPMAWRSDWPIIGADPDGDGIGEPVLEFAAPRMTQPAGANVPGIATSDDFDGLSPGLQWQWQANPATSWVSLSIRRGWLRLNTQPMPASAANLWPVPNLLLQKLPAESFETTVSVDAGGAHDGDAFWLVGFGLDYAGIRARRQNNRIIVEQVICRGATDGASEVVVASAEAGAATAPLMLRMSVASGAIASFSYGSAPDQMRSIGESFPLREGRWVGAKFGVGAVTKDAAGGHFDVDWVKVGK